MIRSGTQLALLWQTDVNASVLSSPSDSVHQNVAFDPSKLEAELEKLIFSGIGHDTITVSSKKCVQTSRIFKLIITREMLSNQKMYINYYVKIIISLRPEFQHST